MKEVRGWRLEVRSWRLGAWGPGLAVLVLLCVSTAGCGYTLAGRGAFLPANIRTIGVPTFTNHTTVFNLETLLTQKVRAELIGRGKYQILPQDTGVDAVLVGDVASVSLVPASFTTQQLASRYTITIVANIQLRDVRENKVLWENPSMVFRQDYDNTSGQSALDSAAFFGQEVNALDRVSTDFARTIISAILEAF
jgi:lipopolysaccharide assembly LptE-like protein